jgi:hypothetical protein
MAYVAESVFEPLAKLASRTLFDDAAGLVLGQTYETQPSRIDDFFFLIWYSMVIRHAKALDKMTWTNLAPFLLFPLFFFLLWICSRGSTIKNLNRAENLNKKDIT